FHDPGCTICGMFSAIQAPSVGSSLSSAMEYVLRTNPEEVAIGFVETACIGRGDLYSGGVVDTDGGALRSCDDAGAFSASAASAAPSNFERERRIRSPCREGSGKGGVIRKKSRIAVKVNRRGASFQLAITSLQAGSLLHTSGDIMRTILRDLAALLIVFGSV